MTYGIDMPARDREAFDAARAAGDLPTITAEVVSELTPEKAVLIGLARHLALVEARVENPQGAATTVRFVKMRDDWPAGPEPSQYPCATLLPQVTSEWDAITGVPVQIDGKDVISDDGAWALWKLGEDVGTAIVHVFACYEAHRDALCAAVEQALFGSLDRLQGLALPLPEDLLPPPFRGLLAVEDRPKARVAFEKGGGAVDDEGTGAGGVWRGDVFFRWQTSRYAARPRIADLANDVRVRVLAPDEEI
jgi:hypothetical protein